MGDRGIQRTWQVLLLACMWAGGASAQAPQGARWSVGDTWVFHQTGGLPATESDWSRKVVEPLPEGRFKVVTEANRDLTFGNEGDTIDNRGPDFAWRRFSQPLDVGKRWKHQRKIAGPTCSGTEQSEWEVKAAEKITVPAGTFDCFRVEGIAFRSWSAVAGAQGMHRAQTQTTYWYCPAIQMGGETADPRPGECLGAARDDRVRTHLFRCRSSITL